MPSRLLACFALLICPLPAMAGEAWDWTQWRGPSRDGQVPALPASLGSLKVDFQMPLGPSYSGPVVDGERIYTTRT